MRYTVLGMYQPRLVELGIDLKEVLILHWMAGFSLSDKMETLKPEDGGREYLWISFKKVIEDLPILGNSSTDTIATHFNNLVACDVLEVRTEKSQHGTRNYYRGGSNYDGLLSTHTKKNSAPGEKPGWSMVAPGEKPGCAPGEKPVSSSYIQDKELIDKQTQCGSIVKINGIPSIQEVEAERKRKFASGEVTPKSEKKQKKGAFRHDLPATVPPPTLEELEKFITQHSFCVDPETFYNNYAPKWVNKFKRPIADWRQTVREWHERDKGNDRGLDNRQLFQKQEPEYVPIAKRTDYSPFMRPGEEQEVSKPPPSYDQTPDGKAFLKHQAECIEEWNREHPDDPYKPGQPKHR